MATVIIQARMGSTRLPGKVLKHICKKPLLLYIIETLKLSSVIDNIIIATSINKENDEIEAFAKKYKINCFRGSEENVLERFYQASQKYPDKYYFRATADNPILDINNPELSLNYLIENNLDYAAVRGMPIGTILECFTKAALERAYLTATSSDDKEHVTLFMKNNTSFNAKYLEAKTELNFPKMRFTVDNPEDFDRVEKIISKLYTKGIPDIKKVIDYVNHNT